MADVLHSTLTATDSHEPKGAESAAINSVYISDGNQSGAWGFTSPPNRIVVTTEADLGIDNGGFIQAPDNTELYIVGTVASPVLLTKELRLGIDTVIQGASPDLAVIEYTGNGTAITGTSRGIVMNSCRLIGPGKATVGSIGMVLDNSAVFQIMLFDNVLIQDFECIASFDVGIGAFFAEGINIFNAVDGLTFIGTSSGNVGFQQGGGFLVDNAIIDLNGSLNGDIFLDNLVATVATASGSLLKGIAAGANVSGRGRMTNCFTTVSGGGAVLDTITTEDIGWDFKNNTEIPDSHIVGVLRSDPSPAETVLDDVTPAKIVGTSTLDPASERVTDGGSDARLTYIGKKPIKAMINISVTGQSSAAGSVNCDIIARTNGDIGTDVVVIADVEFAPTTDSTFSATALSSVEINDYVEIFLLRTSGTADLETKAYSMTAGEA